MAVCLECKVSYGGKCLKCANKVNTQLANATLVNAEKNQSLTQVHKADKNTEIKKRMWGTFFVAICMIILGLISRDI